MARIGLFFTTCVAHLLLLLSLRGIQAEQGKYLIENPLKNPLKKLEKRLIYSHKIWVTRSSSSDVKKFHDANQAQATLPRFQF